MVSTVHTVHTYLHIYFFFYKSPYVRGKLRTYNFIPILCLCSFNTSGPVFIKPLRITLKNTAKN